MKRTTFIKALFGLPFVLPSLIKAEPVRDTLSEQNKVFEKLTKIIAGYNRDKQPLDFKDYKQTKYYNYCYWSDDSWVVVVYGGGHCFLDLPAGLYFATKEDAKECYELYKKDWCILWGIENEFI